MSLNVKIYGQKRTGTNMTECVLNQFDNVSVAVNKDLSGNDAWKHGPAKRLPGIDKYVFCVKNPAAWLVSNKKHDARIDAQPGWQEPRWKTLPEWAAREAQYLRCAYHWPDAIVVDSVRWIQTAKDCAERLQSFLGVPAPATLEFPNNAMSMNGCASGAKFDKSFYTEQKYLSEITEKEWSEMFTALHSDKHLTQMWGNWFNQVRR